MIILGLTGSVGMGKSTVAQMLRALRVPVHASDEAVHGLLDKGGKAVAKVRQLFPETYDPKLKKIDRKKLGQIVFNNKNLRRKLEAVLHPLVQDAQKKFIKQNKHKPLLVLDIPLLYETGAEKRVDFVMVVTAPYKVQKQRVLARPGMNYKRFRQILAAQMPDKIKRKKADIVVPTGCSTQKTKQILKTILKSLERKA